MGTVYQIPRVYYNSGVSAFSTNLMTNEQSAQWNAVKEDGMYIYTVTGTGNGNVTNFIGVSNGNAYIAYYNVTARNINYYIRCDDSVNYLLQAYEREYNERYGYATPVLFQQGIDSKTISSVNNIILPLDYYNSQQEAYDAISQAVSGYYPITYHLTNCTAPDAPTEARNGSDVVISITPSQGYILRSSGVSVVDSNGVSVPYIVQGNQIAFTMPYEPDDGG